MTPVRVRCVETISIDGDPGHSHVVALESEGADARPSRWTLVQAITAIRAGEVFTVEDDRAAERAAVIEPAICVRCPQVTLITHPPDALWAASRPR
jgi:hypothetical protein